MITKITLHETDFINSAYIDHYDCPMARALKRSFPTAKSIIVGGNVAGMSYSLIDKTMIYERYDDFTFHTIYEMDMIVNLNINPVYINEIKTDMLWGSRAVSNIQNVVEAGDFKSVYVDVSVTNRCDGWGIEKGAEVVG